jgi:protocatechuate 3,4-dioxygenase beta subunit
MTLNDAAPTRRNLLLSAAAGFLPARLGWTQAIVTSKNRVEAPGCVLASEQTEGPYYVDWRLIRSDVTEGRPGIPLRLEMLVVDARKCTPLTNAAVSIWHCDASGVYSGYTAQSIGGSPGRGPRPPGFGNGTRPPGPPPGGGFGPGGGPPPHHGPSDETRFFRGVQTTDGEGRVQFATIYPGWYMGRDTHIHLKVHAGGAAKNGEYAGGRVCHTGQLFFSDELSDTVAKLAPYASHRIERTRQQDDDIFTSQHGNEFLLALTQVNPRNMSEGFTTRVVMGVNPDAEPEPVGFGGPPPPRS